VWVFYFILAQNRQENFLNALGILGILNLRQSRKISTLQEAVVLLVNSYIVRHVRYWV
jgi:hypothetical protein